MAIKKITQRVLLIPLDKLTELEIEIKTLKEIPLGQKKEMAVKDLSFFEFMDYVNLSDDFRDISIEKVHCEWYDENYDYFFAEVGNEDSIEVVINNHAEFHICRGDNNGYVVDVYKHFDQNSDHDFDNDEVWEMGWVFDEDIDGLVDEDEDEE